MGGQIRALSGQVQELRKMVEQLHSVVEQQHGGQHPRRPEGGEHRDGPGR